MRALKIAAAIIAAYWFSVIFAGWFGPPGLILAISVVVGWIYARQSGMSLTAMARSLFRR